MEQAGIITIALFMIGVIYYAGRFSVRVEHLESWRDEHNKTHAEIAGGIKHLESLIKGEGG